MRAAAILCAFVATGLASPVDATARIAVTPIRIELLSSANFCSLNVSNLGADKVAVQVRGFAWAQEADGADRLDAAAIAVNPSIMELQPGQKRLVRCSLPPHQGDAESSYRLLVDELPKANPPPGTMQTVLRLSLPIFRKPPRAVASLQWQVREGAAIELRNTGRAHALVSRLIVTRPGLPPEVIERGFYLLAGARRPVPLTGGAAGILKIEAVTAAGRTDDVAKAAD